MGLLGSILKTGFDIVTAPIEVIKDVVPGGGGYVDGNRSHTGKRIDKLELDGKDLRDDLEDL